MLTLLILSLFFSMATISVGVQSSTTKLYVVPSKVEYWTPALNETFMVNVTVANVSNFAGFDFYLYWNTTLLDLVKVDIQPFLNPTIYIDKNETREDLGRYRLCIISYGEPKNGSGPLVTLSFKITHEPTWPENVTCALDLADTDLRDSNMDPIPHDVYDGEYSCYSSPPLAMTTMTGKPSYVPYEMVHIYGNLTLGLLPVQDGIVALQVDDPLNGVVVIRSLSTGVPPANQIVEILHVIPCDNLGNPQNSFLKGSTAHFNVTIRNNDNEIRRVLITINVYDSENRPFQWVATEKSVAAGSTSSSIRSVPILDTASVGDAWVYASAFTEWPSQGGTAYCPEKLATFKILGSGPNGTQTPGSSGNPQGTYNATFKLSSDAEIGNYTIYANSEYTVHEKIQKVTNKVKFRVLGLKWDIDGDGDVDIFDVGIVAKAYEAQRIGGEYWHSPPCPICPHNPNTDIDGDGDVDIFDVAEVAKHYMG